jgi:2,3-dihydroxybiphenyl 1,2-dioxygenase
LACPEASRLVATAEQYQECAVVGDNGGHAMSGEGRNSTDVPDVTQLGYLGIGVSNMGEWREFATDVLGLQESGTGPAGEVYFRLDAYHYRLVLTPTGEDDITLTGWEVKDADALEQVANRLRGLSINVVNGTKEDADARMVLGLVRFNDPDGVPTELYYGPYLDHQPFVSPRVTSGFKASDLGLGHIVRSVDDQESYLRFLTEGLGAKISDYISMTPSVRLVFTHVNPRHHTVALAPYRQAAAGQPPMKRINHLMLEVNSLDDVGFALAQFQRRGIPTGQLGRHTNDHMVSFYGMTPSGFRVEYGTGGRTIDNEDTWEVKHYRAASFWGHGMPAPMASGGR